ncbi:MAG: hypothetical protein JO069_04205 [Verrucomicrobia bacterium]|nr:hypothetical protein [Verrucomicrobiota bacterium]
MPQSPLYEDTLVVLTSDSLLIKGYYFPTRAPKRVALAEVQRIEILRPSLWTGRFRLWGSGDLTTFFPLDLGRPKRDRIFLLTQRHKRVRIGFTVEHSGPFIAALCALPVTVSPKPAV